MGRVMETLPGHRLVSGSKELDIHACRFGSMRANTTAATNGLVVMQAVAARNQR